MERMKLNIQMFSDGKVVIDTMLNSKNFESGLDRMQNATRKAGGTIKSIVAGLGITKMVGYAMGQITSSVDRAIARIDTFDQYPKVLQNFGISVNEAKKSIDRIDKSVRGLPTSLDQAVAGVQNIFMVTKDLGQAEKLFKAMNDSAMIFANGSTEAVDRFSYAFKQAMAKGKIQAQDFNQMNEAIPGVMDKVAESMGKSFSEMKEGLSDGSISIEEFNDALIKLDEKGGAGMESFEKTAKVSTGGIKTAMTNSKTAITRGVADIIGALNQNFEKTKFGSLVNFITDIGKNMEKGLNEIGKLIKGEISAFDFGKEITGIVIKAVDVLRQNIYKATGVGLDFVLSFINGIAEGLPELWAKAQDLVNQFIYAVTDKFQDILDTGLNLAVKFAEGFENENVEVFKAVNKLLDKILSELQKQETINKFVDAGVKIVFAVLVGMIKAIPQLIQIGPKVRNAVMNAVSNIPGKMVSVGVQIVKGIWQGIVNRTGKFGRDMDNWVHNAVIRVKRKLGIKSPSRVFRDEVGKMMAEGIGVGFDDGIKGVYNDMQHAIDLEQAKLQANVETGKVFNTLQNSTPVVINLNADVEMDSTKVGRLVTPAVTRTIKNGGGV